MQFFATYAGLLLLLSAPAFGSFLTVVIDRLPRGESLGGRSRCASCGQRLALRDLVPVLGWLVLGGRCRHCGETIGSWLPTIEITAVAMAIVSGVLLPSPQAWIAAGLGWTLLALAVIDMRHLLLPDALTLPLLAAGLLASSWIGPATPLDHVLGAAVGGAALAAIAALHLRLRRLDGLGFGDVKLFAAAGAWVGWQGLPSVMLIAALSCLAWAVLCGAVVDRVRPVPFGPFIGLGLWLTWLFGPLNL